MTEPDRERIGVLLVDDHRMFAQSLARLLADEPDIDVLGVAEEAPTALAQAAELHPQVVLVDYLMPSMDGVAMTAELKRIDPTMSVVMLTGSADDRVLLAAIEAGCSGFVTKDRAADEVVHAVRAAAAGEALVSPALLGRLLPRLGRGYHETGSDLTEREREVLSLIAHGWTNAVVAARLHLSVNTVRNYVQSILTKLDAHSKLEAVAIAVRAGVIHYPAEGGSTVTDPPT